MPGETISFDVQIVPQDPDDPMSLPSEENKEKVLLYLTGLGVDADPIGVGLACQAPIWLFENIFKVRLLEFNADELSCSAKPQAPNEIAPLIMDITMVREPTLH